MAKTNDKKPNDQSPKMVLQINSLGILEKLIGGDADVEIDVRKSIMKNFLKKNLIMNDKSPIMKMVFTEMFSSIYEDPTIQSKLKPGFLAMRYYKVPMEWHLKTHNECKRHNC